MTTWINLLPPEIQQKRKQKRIVTLFITGFVGLILLLLFVYAVLSYRVYQQEQLLSRRKKEKVNLDSKIAELKSYEAKQVELQRLEDAAARALTGRVLWSRVLNELSMVIPSDVWLSDFSADASTGVSLRGYTFDHPAVAKWMVRQKEIKQFANVGLQYSRKAEIQEQNVIEFSTTAQLAGTQAPRPQAQVPAGSVKR